MFTQQELFRSYFYYNSETGLLYKQLDRDNSLGYKGNAGYLKYSWKQENHRVHRLIWIYMNGDILSDYEIDHRNGNRLDNRISNLRLASRTDNNRNARIRVDNTSGIKGVSWNKTKDKWGVQISVNREIIRLGFYDTLQEAETVIKEARLKYHGEFSNHG